MKELSDEVLMAKVRDGNLDILKILFDRHHKYIYNFVVRMCGDQMQSEDISQEVFYNVMKYRSSYKGGKFIPWLFAIARNATKSHYTKTVENHEDINEAKLKKVEILEENENNDFSRLHRALSELSSSDREILVLHRFQEMTYEDIATLTGSTTSAVKTKACRALKKLRSIYFKN